MPKVLNKFQSGVPSGAVYIGRPSEWGNQFRIGPDGDRDQVVLKYREYIMSNPVLVDKVKSELRGRDLVCFCAPKSCHGDVLLEIANS